MAMSDEQGDDAQEGNVTQNVNVNIEQEDSSPSLIFRAVWFLLIGWWATGVWLTVAWVLNLTIIGMPIGIKMINVVPKVLSFKNRPVQNEVISEDGEVTVKQGSREQRSIVVRGIYFILVGWWLSGIWISIAYLVTLTVIGLPVAIWMYGKLPFLVSLYNY